MHSVVIPYRGESPERAAALDWVLERYRAAALEPVVAEVPADTTVWNKAATAMPAIEAAPDGVVVLADADVWSDGLLSAIRAVTCGAGAWAMPHLMVYRLSEEATLAVLAGQELNTRLEICRKRYQGVYGGGIVVAHRDVLLDVPLDSLFTGPGQEDEAWGIALSTIYGAPWRGSADLYHLWHPPLERLSTRKGTAENWHRYTLYASARGDHDTIRRLLAEGSR